MGIVPGDHPIPAPESTVAGQHPRVCQVSTLVPIAAVAIVGLGFMTATFLWGSRRGWLGSQRVPVAATVLLTVTLVSNAMQWQVSGYLGSMERHHGDLGAGHLWKVFSPLVIQSDGLSQFTTNTIAFVLIVPLAELALGAPPMLVLYVVGGGIAQFVSFWWNPDGGGNSVAVIAVLGGLWATLVIDRFQPAQIQAIAVFGGLVLVVLLLARDQHGAGGVSGLILGAGLALMHQTRPLPLDHPLVLDADHPDPAHVEARR